MCRCQRLFCYARPLKGVASSIFTPFIGLWSESLENSCLIYFVLTRCSSHGLSEEAGDVPEMIECIFLHQTSFSLIVALFWLEKECLFHRSTPRDTSVPVLHVQNINPLIQSYIFFHVIFYLLNPLTYFYSIFFFETKVSLCSPDSPGTHNVDQAGLRA